MEDYKDIRKSFINTVTDNRVVKTIKANPVCTGVATTYVVGSTLAYTAAGVAFKTALAYSFGVALVYGSLAYGVYHVCNKVVESEAKKS